MTPTVIGIECDDVRRGQQLVAMRKGGRVMITVERQPGDEAAVMLNVLAANGITL